MSIDYSMFRSVEVGSSMSGASPSVPSLRYTHVANTRRFYINKPLMKKLDFSMKENDFVRFQIKLGKNEDGHDALFICKEFDRNEPYARGSVKNGVLVFYSTPIGDWIEERIGKVDLNKTKAFADISFDCFDEQTVSIITLPFAVNDNTSLSARRKDEIEKEEQADGFDDDLYEEMDEEEIAQFDLDDLEEEKGDDDQDVQDEEEDEYLDEEDEYYEDDSENLDEED